ncbi:hypothetical protein [Paenibacillus monticola]|uniref:Uncharacterized protein n=1 Tax=Paenibacillus monticola TaxID=2666075 RepID=A0A7X2H6S6_9BACL|nr:hypothetical protein [Paenibacillus monticola]MRN54581.1 hypothetical protein [Paenibacillus monticola]
MKIPFYRKWLFWCIIIVLVGFLVITNGGKKTTIDQAVPTATIEPTQTTEPPTNVPSDIPATTEQTNENWESTLKRLAQSDASATEKSTAAEALARNYKPSKDELLDFESSIVEEYTSENYLANIKDAEYMLNNIFKAIVVGDQHSDDEAISDFAVDFYQNTKYTYQGVHAADSDSIKSNEEQMNKALAKLKK